MSERKHKKKDNSKKLSKNRQEETNQLSRFEDNRKETNSIDSIQRMANNATASVPIIQKKQNTTGLPDDLKTGIENLSGHSMDDVKVHYNSHKPAQLNAHAYAQGTNIHIAAGQEKHLPHEAWHVVQQKQGRVQATKQLKEKVAINDDVGLEREADIMGAKALKKNHPVRSSIEHSNSNKRSLNTSTGQRKATDQIIQREEITGVSGLTHLVRKKGDSIFKGGEFVGSEVTHEDTLVIDTSTKFRSRRGPNQELFEQMDEKGEHSYRWFKVLRLIKPDQQVIDYAHDDIYVRDDALTLEPAKKGARNTVIDKDQRERIDTMEQALHHLPEAEEPTQIIDPGTAWNVARNPEEYGYHQAITNFGNLWNVCGNANENLMIRLQELGTQPKLIKKVDFIGAKGGVALAALLKLPVTKTTIIQVANPQIHEFSLEILGSGTTYLHQGYVSNFDAVWWAGLAESELPHFTMTGDDAERIHQAREAFGKLQPINRNVIAAGLEHFMATDVFCAAADEAWNLLPFPKEGNFARKGERQKEQLKFTVTVFQFENEAAVAAIKKYLTTPLIEVVMKDAESVLKKIKATKGKKTGSAAPQRMNLMAGIHQGIKLKKTSGDEK